MLILALSYCNRYRTAYITPEYLIKFDSPNYVKDAIKFLSKSYSFSLSRRKQSISYWYSFSFFSFKSSNFSIFASTCASSSYWNWSTTSLVFIPMNSKYLIYLSISSERNYLSLSSQLLARSCTYSMIYALWFSGISRSKPKVSQQSTNSLLRV